MKGLNLRVEEMNRVPTQRSDVVCSSGAAGIFGLARDGRAERNPSRIMGKEKGCDNLQTVDVQVNTSMTFERYLDVPTFIRRGKKLDV
ncbi:MAG: hypothetical protein KAI35_09130 [Desulfobulbaceae bacterium]|nr:hypothetical protein [Desulfobulbaceae bacterium]